MWFDPTAERFSRQLALQSAISLTKAPVSRWFGGRDQEKRGLGGQAWAVHRRVTDQIDQLWVLACYFAGDDRVII